LSAPSSRLTAAFTLLQFTCRGRGQLYAAVLWEATSGVVDRWTNDSERKYSYDMNHYYHK
jgi:hypothetical protein